MKYLKHVKKPSLVFCECHHDPAAPKLLDALLPHLIKLGYNLFLDERSSDTTFSSLKREREKLFKHGNIHHTFKLYEKMAESGSIAYEGVDADLIISHRITPATVAYRDRRMAMAHLSTAMGRNAIGSIGLFHTEGMQQVLVQNGARKGDYIFIYPFSLSAIGPLEQAYRDGNVALPLGMHAMELSDESKVNDAVGEVLKLVNSHNKSHPPVRKAREFVVLCKLAEKKVRRHQASPSRLIAAKTTDDLRAVLYRPEEDTSLILREKLLNLVEFFLVMFKFMIKAHYQDAKAKAECLIPSSQMHQSGASSSSSSSSSSVSDSDMPEQQDLFKARLLRIHLMLTLMETVAILNHTYSSSSSDSRRSYRP